MKLLYNEKVMTDSSKLESVKSLQEARHRISNRDKTKIKLNNQKLKDSLVQSMGKKAK